MPILLIERDGLIEPLAPLVKYMLKYRLKSHSWQDKLIQAVELLLDYMEANYNCFDKPEDLFASFTQAVYTGTVDEDGLDPSGLYWLPKRTNTAHPLLIALSEFSDWMHTEYGSKQLNPWREATSYEEQLNWAAYINKSKRSFLGHLDDPGKMAEAAKKARNVMQRRAPSSDHGRKKAFPENQINKLLFEGFKVPGKEKSQNFTERYNWRDMAITILMHGGGLRVSEAFHIWTGLDDVRPDPEDPQLALVRVFHPTEGAAPKDFRGPDGKFLPNREAYLRLKYGLRPRTQYRGNRHAGWKNPKMDEKQNYMHVFWFPRSWGYLFMQVWKLYMIFQRRNVPDTHPFLFVSLRRNQFGEMYTLDAFRDSHSRAVRKIGLPKAKDLGTTEHGHRHSYGQRLTEAKAERRIIQAGMHHKSEESQDVYTVPTIERVTRELAKATEALENGERLPMDFDPDAWFNQEQKHQKSMHKILHAKEK
jgi:site-specific recombinase XerD